MSARATAFHEAGHVAACLILGVEFTTVTTVPGHGYKGQLRGADPDGVAQRVIVDISGVIAVHLLRGPRLRESPSVTQSTVSRWVAQDYGRDEFAGQRSVDLTSFVQHTTRLLAQNWPLVAAIADALQPPCELSYAQVLAVAGPFLGTATGREEAKTSPANNFGQKGDRNRA
ncbi:MAG TPA: hypothetical protein VLW50_33990 [Streptosporangiaceae bacterium]|nr:hypothetical protein [Streptosporangiaceae bacterium]